ncbi:MAG: signal peptidase I [Candidatus Peregrinibacteria bacterium Greene0416_62]|nr:MAG: signal peptidase I [Candidatus Peregrinibacteria bacterium Greene0416_62]
MQKQRSILWHLLDVVLNIVIIVGIVAGIRTFLVSPFQVEGDSMLDTLEHKQYIIINKLAYFTGNPVRGDVVVFRPPSDHKKHYVKRIIGIPGDVVIIRGGKAYLKTPGSEKAVELSEPYLNEHNANHTYAHPPNSGKTEEQTFEIPEGHYFLLGDNRQGSLDSRSFGAQAGGSAFVPDKDIKGKVWFVALPISQIHVLEAPSYGL